MFFPLLSFTIVRIIAAQRGNEKSLFRFPTRHMQSEYKSPREKMFVPLVICFCLMLVCSCAAKKPSGSHPADSRERTKGSQKPYTVNGQRYEPLKSHERFVQEGIASWYGKDFHGKKTSNGEKYDMHAMTAAHKTLPLGVFVKVRSAKNGREAVVRINDRGPFVKGRIIDLSYAAAKSLGVDVAGTARVRIEALGYRGDGANKYKAPATYDSGNYTVQVGSFKERANAERLAGEMKKRSPFSDVRRTDVNGEVFYRVYAGKYGSLEAAGSAEKNFADLGYPGSFVVALD
jgi:rare lipoprotein A